MKVVNCKVAFIRKNGYDNFTEWNSDPKHLYIGRNLVYVKAPKSKWANPFTVKKYGREKCLEMYEEYVRNGPLWNDLDELKDYECLGCWCAPETCHGDILIRLYTEKMLKKL